MDYPLISVCIPTYNCGQYLKQCLDSVRAQTYPAIEILVLDDGSTDNTAEILTHYPEIRVLHQNHLGVAAGRNTLIHAATGDFIAFLDADDAFHPEKLERQMAYFIRHPEAQVVFTQIENFYDTPELAQNPDAQRVFSVTNRVILPSALFRRTVFDLVTFDPALIRAEDTAFNLQMQFHHIDMTHFISDVLYLRRVRAGSLTVTAPPKKETYGSMLASLIRNRRAKPAPLSPAVIIPAYNAAAFIQRAVDSVRKAFPNARILVVDDGSQDATPSLVAALPNVKLLTQRHTNAATARNAGIAALPPDTQTVLFLDADDQLSPDAAHIWQDALAANPNADAIASLAQNAPDGVPYGGLLSGCVLFKYTALKQLGAFRDSLNTAETVDFLLRLRDSALRCVKVDQVTCIRGIHESNSSRMNRDALALTIASILRTRH